MIQRGWIACLLACLWASAQGAPDPWGRPDGFVTDRAGVVDGASRRSLENLLGELRQKTGAEVAVVTLKDLGGRDLESAAVELFKAWGIGQKGKDNGVLILVAIQDHKARIEVGYGLEGVIPDGAAGSLIRDRLAPAFRQGDYGGGLLSVAGSVADRIARDAGVTLTGRTDENGDGEDGGGNPHPFLVLVLLVLLILFRLFLFSRGIWWGGGYGGGYGGGGFGGGGGGGFGGFGGGGSGGGGASGGW